MSDTTGKQVELVENDSFSGYGGCAFVDALGTTELLGAEGIASAETFTQYVESQASSQDTMLAVVKSLKTTDDSIKELFTVIFSDSTFVIGFSGENEDDFAHARCLSAVAQVAAVRQLLHFLDGRLCRGGLAAGSIYAKGNAILGSPVSIAVGIEQRIAVGPCITLSKRSESFIRNLLYFDKSRVIGRSKDLRDNIVSSALFVYDAVGNLIVNPYAVLKRLSIIDQPEAHRELLVRIYETIISGLQANELRPDVYRKYAFARDFHNANVRRDDLGDYIIPVSGSEVSNKFASISTFLEEKKNDIFPSVL